MKRVVRPSIAERRLLTFCETCGVQPSLRQLATKIGGVKVLVAAHSAATSDLVFDHVERAVARSAVPLASVNRASTMSELRFSIIRCPI